jgi:hypothetical protein
MPTHVDELYFSEDKKSKKYQMSLIERKELYKIAQKSKNVNSIIIRKWLLRPYYVGDVGDVKQLLKHMCMQGKRKNEIKTAEKQYILDKWTNEGLYTIKKTDIERLCE